MGIFEQIFAPSMSHRDEERQRLVLAREDVGDGAPPTRGPIDLDGGRVVIRSAPDMSADSPDTGAGGGAVPVPAPERRS